MWSSAPTGASKISMSLRTSAHTGAAIPPVLPGCWKIGGIVRLSGGLRASDIGHWLAMTALVWCGAPPDRGTTRFTPTVFQSLCAAKHLFFSLFTLLFYLQLLPPPWQSPCPSGLSEKRGDCTSNRGTALSIFCSTRKNRVLLLFDFYSAHRSASVKGMTCSSSCMDSSIWQPIFPALKKTVPQSAAERSITVVNSFFIPMGEQPP